MKTNIQEMRYLAGLTPVMEESDTASNQTSVTEEEVVALAEAKVSINQKLRDAEHSFLGNVAVLARKYIRQENKGVRVDTDVLPGMGKGSIGSVRFTGDGWQIDFVVDRVGDRWRLSKYGTMHPPGHSVAIEMKDSATADDLQADILAMAANAYYGGLTEKAAKAMVG